MNLYLISQNVNSDWDTYDSAIVVAFNPDEAKRIHPLGNCHEGGEWEWWHERVSSWAYPDDVEAEWIGLTDRTPGTVILASYNVG